MKSFAGVHSARPGSITPRPSRKHLGILKAIETPDRRKYTGGEVDINVGLSMVGKREALSAGCLWVSEVGEFSRSFRLTRLYKRRSTSDPSGGQEG